MILPKNSLALSALVAVVHGEEEEEEEAAAAEEEEEQDKNGAWTRKQLVSEKFTITCAALQKT
jgi:hypothetical protein